ncbi:MAG: class 1 isoprenoid biosynthesis enzyme [Chitinophagaceae bacterium]|nr:class 1 isoprenoid biosynthesis enzyme [Chitinophagaceae bacterium]
MNYCTLSYYAADYGLSAYKQLRFIQSFLKPLVEKHCNRLNYPLSKKEQKKVDFYYPLFNHIVNCENYLCIKGRRLTKAESKRLAILSAMATLYDDLIDEENWEKEQYFQILNRTLSIELQTPKVQLIFALDDELNKIWQPTQAYKNALQLAIEWQVISAKQLQENLSLEETLHISENKCGNSSLLWASILDEHWLPEDEAFIYQSGYVGQIVNDLFDAFKDREDGVFTIVRKAPSIAVAKEIFLSECAKLHQLIEPCNVAKSKQRKTIRRMACIHAFALVSLDHLQNTENKYGLPINWQQPLRRELVTDMAFWSNKFKLIYKACWLAELR